MKYRQIRRLETLARITDDDFDGGHPNEHHVPGVVYDPRRRCVMIGGSNGYVGDWIAKDDSGFLVMTDHALRTYWEPCDGEE